MAAATETATAAAAAAGGVLGSGAHRPTSRQLETVLQTALGLDRAALQYLEGRIVEECDKRVGGGGGHAGRDRGGGGDSSSSSSNGGGGSSNSSTTTTSSSSSSSSSSSAHRVGERATTEASDRDLRRHLQCDVVVERVDCRLDVTVVPRGRARELVE